MQDVYLNSPVPKNKYYYEFSRLTDNDGSTVLSGNSILIAVNSEQYSNDLIGAYKPKLNIFELMSFIANNLMDEDFSKFVFLTLQNRSFWQQIWDSIWTKLYRFSDQLIRYDVELNGFRNIT